MPEGFFPLLDAEGSLYQGSRRGFVDRAGQFSRVARSDTLPRLIHIANDPFTAEAWTMHDLKIAPQYAAALAYIGERAIVRALPVISAVDLFAQMMQSSIGRERNV